MTRQLQYSEADMTMVLPGTWASFSLADDPENEAKLVGDLVKRQVGTNDRLARVRRDAREQLKGVLSGARRAGAFRVGLSLEILPGVPFPAAMILRMIDWPIAAQPEQTLGERLKAAYPRVAHLDLACGPVARRGEFRDVAVGSEATTDLKLEYWVARPDGEKLVHIDVDLPTAADRELYTELVDAIVDSIRWFPAPSAAEQPAPTSPDAS